MMKLNSLWATLGACIVFSGCTAKIDSALRLDGQPFVPKACRSGQAYGFTGVELADEKGDRLRLVANPDGTCAAALLKNGSPSADVLGQCGTLAIRTQSSRINSIYNIEGTANLSCLAAGRRLEGSVRFENCH